MHRGFKNPGCSVLTKFSFPRQHPIDMIDPDLRHDEPTHDNSRQRPN